MVQSRVGGWGSGQGCVKLGQGDGAGAGWGEAQQGEGSGEHGRCPEGVAVAGGHAFKGGGAPRLGLGPEAALKVMAHSGPRAGGGSPQGVVGEGGRGGVGLSP